MRFARITGTGSFLPGESLSNQALVERLAAQGVESSDEWIVERTGIKARHFAADDQKASDLAAVAARHAMEAAGKSAADIDLIIVATSTPDMVFPSTACIVQNKLGIQGCPAFDVQAVCAGFVYGADRGRCDDPHGCRSLCAGDRCRGVLTHPRLQRPHHLRAVWRRRRCGGARGQRAARHPGQRTARRRPPCRHPVCAGQCLRRAGEWQPLADHGRTGRLQARGGCA